VGWLDHADSARSCPCRTSIKRPPRTQTSIIIVSTLTRNGWYYGRRTGYERQSANERETYNIRAITLSLLPEQNTLIDVQAMKTSLLAIERESYILTTIINTVLQESTLIGRLQSISRDLEAVLTHMEWRHTPAQHKANPPCISHTSLDKRHSSVIASNTTTNINPSLKTICNTSHCKASPP